MPKNSVKRGVKNAKHELPKGLICGVDEAGRGPLAGPVVAAAVVLGGNVIEGLDDSKKLSDTRRRELAPIIKDQCLAYALGASDVSEIDEYNIRQATMFAMQRAVDGIVICPDIVLVDGDFTPDFAYPARPLIGGDTICPEIMAASILAKTTRDNIMLELDKQYPDYGFAQHKGYGVPRHLKALQSYGPCEVHRRSFAPVRKCDKMGG